MEYIPRQPTHNTAEHQSSTHNPEFLTLTKGPLQSSPDSSSHPQLDKPPPQSVAKSINKVSETKQPTDPMDAHARTSLTSSSMQAGKRQEAGWQSTLKSN